MKVKKITSKALLAESRDEATLTLYKFYDAFRDKKWERIEQFLAKDFRYFTDRGTDIGKGRFMEIQKKDTWHIKEYRVFEYNISCSPDGRAALLTYKISFAPWENSGKNSFMAIETMFLAHSTGSWLIKHFHTSNIF